MQEEILKIIEENEARKLQQKEEERLEKEERERKANADALVVVEELEQRILKSRLIPRQYRIRMSTRAWDVCRDKKGDTRRYPYHVSRLAKIFNERNPLLECYIDSSEPVTGRCEGIWGLLGYKEPTGYHDIWIDVRALNNPAAIPMASVADVPEAVRAETG